MPDLSGQTVLVLHAHPDDEAIFSGLTLRRLADAGARTVVVSLTGGEIQARDHDLADAGTFAVDQLVGAASVDDYDALLLPGGTVNPDKLRTEPDAVRFVRDFVLSGKPVASICHGPWMLVEADVVKGRTVTSWPSIRTDLKNAGGDVVDKEVAVVGHLITSRKPDDIPAFIKTALEEKADCVIGSRYSKGIRVINWPLKRLILSMGAGMYVRAITGLPLSDVSRLG